MRAVNETTGAIKQICFWCRSVIGSYAIFKKYCRRNACKLVEVFEHFCTRTAPSMFQNNVSLYGAESFIKSAQYIAPCFCIRASVKSAVGTRTCIPGYGALRFRAQIYPLQYLYMLHSRNRLQQPWRSETGTRRDCVSSGKMIVQGVATYSCAREFTISQECSYNWRVVRKRIL